MNKTVSVSISGTLFHFEDSAYQKLEKYLREVKEYFKDYDEHGEIIKDIESRIAEMLIEKRGGVEVVIGEAWVEDVKTSMGTVADFAEFEEGENKSSNGSSAASNVEKKKLYRDADDKLLGGVASGVAHYFEVDVLAVRLIFILLLIFTQWFAVAAYILFWSIVPEAKTSEEKKAMRGGGVPTLVSIKEQANKAADSVKKARGDETLKTKTIGVLNQLGEVVSYVLRAVFVIAGAGIALSALAIAVFGTLTALFLALGNFPIFVDAPVLNDPLVVAAYGSWEYFVVLVSVYIVGLIPLLVAMSLGMTLVQKRSWLKTSDVIGLMALWIIGAIVGTVVFLQTAPKYERLLEEGQSTEILIPNNL